jgi:hypothetical protein
MAGRYARFAFGLALVVALGFVIAHANAARVPDSLGLSAPCEPAFPAFRAAAAWKTASTTETSFDAESIEVAPAVLRRSRSDTVARVTPLLASWAVPSLWYRPPPANS